MIDRAPLQKSADAYRTISEVAADLKLPQHVLRFWETRFAQVKPLKRAGGRRFYRPEDVELLRAVKALLYGDGYTIKGVQRILREQGPRAVAALASTRSHGGRRPGGAPEDVGGVTAHPDHAPTDPEIASDTPPPARIEGSLDELVTGDPVARLRAVLADLAECERVLAAVRSAAG